MDQSVINPPPAPSTPAMAPWQDFQKLIKLMTTLIEIYEVRGMIPGTQALIQLEGGGVAAAPGATQVAISLDSQIQTPWVDTAPEEIFNESIREAIPFKSQMYYWGGGKRLLIWVESSLDQQASLQVKGNIRSNMEMATEIGPPLPCKSNGVTTIGLAWDDWHPYIGVLITLTTAPTEGKLKIEVAEQV